MNKIKTISAIAKDANTTAAIVARVLDSLANHVQTALQAGDDDVRVPGIVKMKVVERAARTGRNPRTGETLAIPASKAVKFTALKVFKDGVQ